MFKAKKDIQVSTIDLKTGRWIIERTQNMETEEWEIKINFQFPNIDSRVKLTDQEITKLKQFALPIAQRIPNLHTWEEE